MKPYICVLSLLVLLMSACSSVKNPFYSEFKTPFGVPPFSEITLSHYMPAFKEGIRREKGEIASIADNPDAPTFANTIDALEMTGSMLDRVSNVFYVLDESMTNDEMQKISTQAAPLLSAHRDEILLNEKLFRRIKDLYEMKESLVLTTEQRMVLEKYYKDFVRGGSLLDEKAKTRLKEINQELSLLSIQFGENVLKEVNKWEMVLENEADLAGLPGSAIQAASETAKEKGYEGKWVFTIQKPSMIPFLQYSERRDLREKIFTAYIMQGDHNDELDNKAILSKMAALRVEKARLLGYATHADFVLEENMAKNPGHVIDLLNRLWKPALSMAKREMQEMQVMIDAEGGNFRLQPWDWWYYAEKIKKAKYDLDEEMLRPYFKLENVIGGAFTVANRLWGLQFIKRDDIPKYHEDVTVYELKDSDGTHLGLLYTDYFPRESKRGGAWSNGFQEQSRVGGIEKRPINTNNGNFTKPTADAPSLLTLEEVQTLFHEFGHALQDLLSDCTYPRVSGTNVSRDYVELCSQFMEHWVTEPEIMKLYARHYKTNEPIPDELIQKIENAGHFNQGFATVEYLAASFLDMDWHTLAEPKEPDANVFEKACAEKIGLIPEIVFRYRSPYFRHIFSGGYSAGYYGYIWAEVLDCDAFEAFKEHGLFDQKTAQSLRKNIYSSGGTEDPMVLYKRFRGREPRVEALLKKRGLM